jgi:hypothetical protein
VRRLAIQIDNEENFDWVTALSSCSVNEVFVRLKQQVEQDVETRNKQLTHSGFKFIATGESFTVLTEDHRTLRSVTFKRGTQDITVQDEDNAVMLKATLTFNEEGECRLKVKDRELCLWKVRKMALEDLLFGA